MKFPTCSCKRTFLSVPHEMRNEGSNVVIQQASCMAGIASLVCIVLHVMKAYLWQKRSRQVEIQGDDSSKPSRALSVPV